MNDKRLRDLEREFRKERAEILADEGMSWEKKMFAVRDLFETYSRKKEALPEEKTA
jgi:hypothetical protein